MYRLVKIVDRNGQVRLVPMTAQLADFYLRLATLRANTDPQITFHDVVIEQMTRVRQIPASN